MDSHELTEWYAYMDIEPLPVDRADLNMGIVAATIANYGDRAPKEAALPSDFMPRYGEEPAEQENTDGVLLDDPEAQSALILKMCFGKGA
ncbi:phage tail assembly protein T [Burkholderia gladioli]|uniref:phage tail assembly protein T n=1 Tax=Burkholderia gladioli TaxID=28095 RepID=UPI003C7D49CB